MASYLLKADAARFDAWRAAQKAGGFPSLAAYIRAAADAGVREPARVEASAILTETAQAVSLYAPGAAAPLLARVPERAFRPDPRPVPKSKGRR